MSAYGWHCDMIAIPAVRHSDTTPVKKKPHELLYIDYNRGYDNNNDNTYDDDDDGGCCTAAATNNNKCKKPSVL